MILAYTNLFQPVWASNFGLWKRRSVLFRSLADQINPELQVEPPYAYIQGRREHEEGSEERRSQDSEILVEERYIYQMQW